MSANVTLAELRERVRELADMQTNVPEESDDELDRAVNRGLKRLYDLLIAAWGGDRFTKSVVLNSVNGTSTYGINQGFPLDFYVLVKALSSDGTSFFEMPQWGFDELASLLELEASSSSSIIMYRYRLMANAVEIRPAPLTDAHTFTLYYVPVFEPLTEDESFFDGVNGWEDWACYTAAIDLLNKEESFEQSAALAAQRVIVEGSIHALAGNRDAAEPAEVQDLRKDRWSRFYRRLYREEPS